MTTRFIFFTLYFVLATVSYGQRLNDYYVSISVDSSQGGRLKFLSDTTVELSSFPRHMSPTLKKVYKYTTTDTTIEILPDAVINQDKKLSGLNIPSFVITAKITLTKTDGGFIDYNKSLIYVRQKDFGDNPDITYIIDGKTFIQDAGVTDYLGIIKKKPRPNKALQKKLKGVDKDNCTIEIVKGLNAYKRFGLKTVYGAVVITTKK